MLSQTKDKWEYGQVETAMCLWEAFLELQGETGADNLPTELAEKLCEIRSQHGSFVMRAVIAGLADDCDSAWEAREALDGQDHIAFDFEFCPEFIAGALDSGLLTQSINNQYGGNRRLPPMADGPSRLS
jgi:hypothetical protein